MLFQNLNRRKLGVLIQHIDFNCLKGLSKLSRNKNEGLTRIKLFLQDGKLSFSKLQGTNKLVMTTQYENAECKERFKTQSMMFKVVFVLFTKIIKAADKILPYFRTSIILEVELHKHKL